MNTTVPRSIEDIDEGTRDAALAAARRSGLSLGEWLDKVIAERSATASVPSSPSTPSDHAAEMEAIAEQLASLSGKSPSDSQPARKTGTRATMGFDAAAAIRDAVAEIAKRQADLDRHGEAPAGGNEMPAPPPQAPVSALAEPAAEQEVPAGIPGLSGPPPRWSTQLEDVMSRSAGKVREPLGSRRPGADLSAEVSQTFARFSRDLQDAIQATDARPKVDSLDRQVRRIGRAVDGLGQNLPNAETLDRIGEQTREMRDLLKASSARAVPFDGVEQQVSSLEQRLSRLGDLPVGTVQPPHFDETMKEVRALLDGINPGVAALDARLADLTSRIERGLAAEGPTDLIEGLSRRVEEIHATLHNKLADTAMDTRPLEGLVRGLSDRLGQAHEASADFEHLETAMREVAAKIDAAAGEQDPRGVQAVEAQLIRLTERLDRSDASLRALDGVEHSLGQLFSQFEVTRQVAIDAAETAARTAARDTLRAALQSPGLATRAPDASPGLAEQVARGLEELRALQDSAQRRTETTLLDLRDMMERLTQDAGSSATASRNRASTEDMRRRRVGPETAAQPRQGGDPADILIEPGLGRGPVAPIARPEPRLSPAVDEVEVPVGPVDESDGPASFIAAARRAAKAAQASAASTAAQKGGERRPTTPRVERQRDRRNSHDATAGSPGALVQAKAFLARRRRPILLGLAALVLLVGALEVLKLGVTSSDETRVGAAQLATPVQTRTAALDAQPATAKLPAAVLPPVAAPVAPALPTFVAGPSKPQLAADGIGEGLRNLASAGDAAAQYEVGLRYAEGRGVARDPKQALAWFDKAAAQGSAPSQYRLGSAYEKGVGVDRDPALAMSWYGKAADAGNIRAMHNLAVMSAEGAAGKPDYAKAAQWFSKASEFGVRDSQFNLAILYARGLGIEQSLIQSYKWFAVAASGGDDDAAKKRDEVAAKLDPATLASAKAAAAAYHAAVSPASANEVAPPPGGWDAASAHLPAPSSPAKVSQL